MTMLLRLALIVKGSKTERYRDKMMDLLKYMNRNRLGRDIRNQIKGHLLLQYESAYTDAVVLQDIPISIRAKISQNLYQSYIENVPLFKGCSSEFISQVVTRVPGEVIMEQGNVVDQLYFIRHGVLEVGLAKDGSEETVSLLEPNSSFGDISIICNIPQPYTVRVCELCRLIHIDKQSFSNILEIYFHDGRRILSNLLQGKESNLRMKQLESDIALHIGKHEVELALKLNSAAYHASRGYEDITSFLIQEGVDINAPDKFGNTPVLEAIKSGHDRVASLLVKEGALLNIENAGSFLCMVIERGIQIYYEDYCQTVLIRTPKTMISECHFMLLLLKDNTQWQGCFWEPVLLFSQSTDGEILQLMKPSISGSVSCFLVPQLSYCVVVYVLLFVIIYVSFDIILSAYLISNMTALIVKGSKTERFRDKMTDLLKYMKRNQLGRDIRNQIKGHLHLQYESAYTDAAVLQDIPIYI
ncbi:Potassium channel KOR1 [Capsicum annuum]|nr:Potassium channel KOR1 [Capsicum annuum]